MSAEVWKPVPGYEGAYEVSDHGRVRSLDRVVTRADGVRRRYPGRVLRPGTLPKGYRQVGLSCDGAVRYRYVHALVAQAFIGPRQPGQEVRHRRGLAAGDGVANVYYGTPRENAADKFDHGTQPLGEQHWRHVLTAEAVREIRRRPAESSAHFARKFGCSATTIYDVRQRKTWRHVA